MLICGIVLFLRLFQTLAFVCIAMSTMIPIILSPPPASLCELWARDQAGDISIKLCFCQVSKALLSDAAIWGDIVCMRLAKSFHLLPIMLLYETCILQYINAVVCGWRARARSLLSARRPKSAFALPHFCIV